MSLYLSILAGPFINISSIRKNVEHFRLKCSNSECNNKKVLKSEYCPNCGSKAMKESYIDNIVYDYKDVLNETGLNSDIFTSVAQEGVCLLKSELWSYKSISGDSYSDFEIDISNYNPEKEIENFKEIHKEYFDILKLSGLEVTIIWRIIGAWW
jgi:hypothetical protein